MEKCDFPRCREDVRVQLRMINKRVCWKHHDLYFDDKESFMKRMFKGELE